MRSFKLKIQQRAYNEVQQGITYYNKQQKGLGKKFHKAVKSSFQIINDNPFYQVRYENVRCFPVAKFPYMLHYTVNETDKIIVVYAVINTHLDPQTSYVK